MFNEIKNFVIEKDDVFINDDDLETHEFETMMHQGLKLPYEELEIQTMESDIIILENVISTIKTCKDSSSKEAILSFMNKNHGLEKILGLSSKELLKSSPEDLELKMHEFVNKVEENNLATESFEIRKRHIPWSLEDTFWQGLPIIITYILTGLTGALVTTIILAIYIVGKRTNLFEPIDKYKYSIKHGKIFNHNKVIKIPPYKKLVKELNLTNIIDKLGDITLSSNKFPRNSKEYEQHIKNINNIIKPFTEIYGIYIEWNNSDKPKIRKGKLISGHKSVKETASSLEYDAKSFDHIAKLVEGNYDRLVDMTHKHKDNAEKIVKKMRDEITVDTVNKESSKYIRQSAKFNARIYNYCARLYLDHLIYKTLLTLKRLSKCYTL